SSETIHCPGNISSYFFNKSFFITLSLSVLLSHLIYSVNNLIKYVNGDKIQKIATPRREQSPALTTLSGSAARNEHYSQILAVRKN
ncbi:MAG: hypothetical protein KKC78_03775, partial [Proteobacteria bacterium]|nr:hypothetical protein [Pseudomonadota bacterium]